MTTQGRLAIYKTLPGVMFLLVWELSVRNHPNLIFFFGEPSVIGSYFVSRMASGRLEVDIAVTFIEALGGFCLGNILGVIAGLGLWYSRMAFELSRPYVIVLGAAPIFALAPLLIIWFGTGILAKIAIATVSTVFVALLQSYNGASAVNLDYIRLMKSFGATKHQVFRKVIAPSSIAWVVSAFRMNVGLALLGAFIGEYISSSSGLGHMILVASGLFNISLVLCGVFCLVSIALVLNVIISRIELPLKRAVVRYL